MDSANTAMSVFWEDVSEGDILPSFDYELSLLRMVAFVRASGLYDYVHFDGEYARAAGARDVFISTPHVAGLFGRLITDWTGPDAAIRSLTFRINRQIYRGEMLTVSGRVARKFRGEDGEYLVEVGDLSIDSIGQPAGASASAVIELRSSTGTIPAPTRPSEGISPVSPKPDMPDFARAQLGVVKQGNKEPERPLTEDEIHLWCEALEDWNPLYWDKRFAQLSRFGRIVAPQASMFYGAGSSVVSGLGYEKPGAIMPDPVRQGLTGVSLLQGLRQGLMAAGSPFPPPDCPEVAVTNATFEFYTPLGVGDTLRSEQRLLDCSQRKRTRLGEGYFVTCQTVYFNQRDELVKTLTMNLFYYRV